MKNEKKIELTSKEIIRRVVNESTVTDLLQQNGIDDVETIVYVQRYDDDKLKKGVIIDVH